MIFVHSVVNCDQIKKIECLFSFKTIVEDKQNMEINQQPI